MSRALRVAILVSLTYLSHISALRHNCLKSSKYPIHRRIQKNRAKEDKNIVWESTFDPKRRSIIGALGGGILAIPFIQKKAAYAASNNGEASSQYQIDSAKFPWEILKPLDDPRSFRSIRLSNGLDVLLVQDPTVEGAAACVDVHVGHYSDPLELPGLAHFCEHMRKFTFYNAF